MLICQELVDGWLGRIKLMIITGSCLIGPDRGEDRASKACDAGDRGIDKQIFGQVLFSSFCTCSKWRLQLTVWKCSSSYMWVYNHSCRGYISYIQPIVVIAILTYTILYSIICNLNCTRRASPGYLCHLETDSFSQTRHPYKMCLAWYFTSRNGIREHAEGACVFVQVQ